MPTGGDVRPLLIAIAEVTRVVPAIVAVIDAVGAPVGVVRNRTAEAHCPHPRAKTAPTRARKDFSRHMGLRRVVDVDEIRGRSWARRVIVSLPSRDADR